MPKRCFAILILLLVFPTCAQMKSGPAPQASVQESGHIKHTVAAGDHQKIINDYKAEYARRPHDQALTKDYVKSLEEIKMAADRASEREDFAAAGKTYKLLLINYSDFRAFAHMLSFDKTKLNTKLAVCKDALSKKGFQEYRQGNLSQAIFLWQDYLAIDPNNADIKKAVNTAKLQQKKPSTDQIVIGWKSRGFHTFYLSYRNLLLLNIESPINASQVEASPLSIR